MYKYIFTAIIIALFVGCSVPKPDKAPLWYTSLPQDTQFFYATGYGINKLKAKNNAISNLRTGINYDLDKVFLNKTTKLTIAKEQDIKPILKENEVFSNTIIFRGLKVEKTAIFKNDYLVLIKLPRSLIFDYADKSFTEKFADAKVKYSSFENKLAIKKYANFLKEMPNYNKLASLIEIKKLSKKSYNADEELLYLNKIGNEFFKLKQNISIHILSDVNSRIYVPSVKDAIIASGLTISNKPLSENSLKLFITSKTTNTKDYSFNQSKTLVKYRTYNQNKEEVSFRQHTFITKSRLSYTDARQQSIVKQKNMIKKLEIYDYIGFNK